VVAGRFEHTPRGIILHGSRSGVEHATLAEFQGTALYAINEPDGYGWNATVGEDVLAVHMSVREWGWNARACSDHYLAVEFAQGTVADAISDAQVRAFAWFAAACRNAWPQLVMNLPTHAELDGTADYGGYVDGKTDVFPKADARANELRARILALLALQYGMGVQP
jgi:hypothetical protein